MRSANRTSTPFATCVLDLVRTIPPGRVVSYGAVAAFCGSPRAARGVGAVLSGTVESGVPWWRVVNRAGALTIPPHLGLRALQRQLLEDEEVAFDEGGRVRLDIHAWHPEGTPEDDRW
ncbi:MAG: MGMT family protein [Longimicrobiales bacterium]|nr:MGMT family protein [Longimicrobiales bacterium]